MVIVIVISLYDMVIVMAKNIWFMGYSLRVIVYNLGYLIVKG